MSLQAVSDYLHDLLQRNPALLALVRELDDADTCDALEGTQSGRRAGQPYTDTTSNRPAATTPAEVR